MADNLVQLTCSQAHDVMVCDFSQDCLMAVELVRLLLSSFDGSPTRSMVVQELVRLVSSTCFVCLMVIELVKGMTTIQETLLHHNNYMCYCRKNGVG